MSDSRRVTDKPSGAPTVIGKGIRVKGEIGGSAPIEVYGSLEGKSSTEGLFWVREGGEVSGEIEARDVVVEGKVEGIVRATEKAELRPSAKVRGELTAHTLAIAEGSFFEGKITMAPADKGGSPQKIGFKEKRRPGDSPGQERIQK